MKNNNLLCISTHTSPTRGFGGPSVSFRHFLDFLYSKDISYTLITTNPYRFKIIKKEKITELFLPTLIFHKVGFSLFSFLSIIYLSIFKKTLVINGITSIPNFSALIGSLINSKSKVIIFGHGSFEIDRVRKWFILKRLYYKLNLLIVKYLNSKNRLLVIFQSQSEMEKSLLNNKLRYKIIGNIEEFTFENMQNKNLIQKNNTKEIDLIYVGRYSHEKGIDRLLRILKIFKSKNSKFKIVLIFDSLDKKKITNIRKLTLGLNCEIFINLENSLVLETLSKSKLIFFPSYLENYGNVLIEAVIMGSIPVLYDNTHWWDMYPECCYSEKELINLIDNNFIYYDKKLSNKSKEYVYINYIKNNSFQSVLDFIFL